MKKEIYDTQKIYIDDITVEEAIRILEKYEGMGATLDFDDDDDIHRFQVTYQREETDREYKKRLDHEKFCKEYDKQQKKNREAKEKKEYERLKKKYETE